MNIWMNPDHKIHDVISLHCDFARYFIRFQHYKIREKTMIICHLVISRIFLNDFESFSKLYHLAISRIFSFQIIAISLQEWQPPFAVDVDRLKFTPRIQRLNELEAHTRIKLNFLDQVAKFWELQGSTLKIPLVEKRALDLYTLKNYVKKEGGMEVVTAEKKWPKVAQDMGYNPQNKNIANLLKAHYERILYPLEVFQQQEEKKNAALKEEIKEEPVNGEKEYKPHNIPSRMGMKVPTDKEKGGRRTGRMNDQCGSENASPNKQQPQDEKNNSFSKELARLQFFGAGPKMAGMPNEKTSKEKTRGVKLNFEYDPLAKYMCQNCGKGDAEEQMLLCDGCDDSYHTFCLMPPLAEIPKGDWRCPKCIAAEVSKPMEAFGFEQAQKEYTLQTFGEMADQFKSDYFNMPVSCACKK